jgi:NADPH-dependent glutamate synthase beta subunit-like oxidoreductase
VTAERAAVNDPRIAVITFSADNVRFVGNIEVGRDLTHDELAACYDAVVCASGTERDRCLDIPGENLPGVLGSGEFVRWYNGHPDAAGTDFSLDAEQVAVVGAGNVALDVARVLGRTAGDWAGWLRLEEYEGALGAAAGRGRVKVHDLESMLRCCATTMRQ